MIILFSVTILFVWYVQDVEGESNESHGELATTKQAKASRARHGRRGQSGSKNKDRGGSTKKNSPKDRKKNRGKPPSKPIQPAKVTTTTKPPNIGVEREGQATGKAAVPQIVPGESDRLIKEQEIKAASGVKKKLPLKEPPIVVAV